MTMKKLLLTGCVLTAICSTAQAEAPSPAIIAKALPCSQKLVVGCRMDDGDYFGYDHIITASNPPAKDCVYQYAVMTDLFQKLSLAVTDAYANPNDVPTVRNAKLGVVQYLRNIINTEGTKYNAMGCKPYDTVRR
jgi:hypothetical protein